MYELEGIEFVYDGIEKDELYEFSFKSIFNYIFTSKHKVNDYLTKVVFCENIDGRSDNCIIYGQYNSNNKTIYIKKNNLNELKKTITHELYNVKFEINNSSIRSKCKRSDQLEYMFLSEFYAYSKTLKDYIPKDKCECIQHLTKQLDIVKAIIIRTSEDIIGLNLLGEGNYGLEVYSIEDIERVKSKLRMYILYYKAMYIAILKNISDVNETIGISDSMIDKEKYHYIYSIDFDNITVNDLEQTYKVI